MNITAIKKSEHFTVWEENDYQWYWDSGIKFKHLREMFLALADRTGVVHMVLIDENKQKPFKVRK